MSVDNKTFVKKSQEILKEMGVEVKSTQLYELYSKLSGEKNWNVAKSKKVEFHNLVASPNSPVKIGFPELEEMMGGGLVPVKTYNFYAGTNMGKTSMLVSMGCGVLRNSNEKVLHLNLDGNIIDIVVKYAANLMDMPVKKIREGASFNIPPGYNERLKIQKVSAGTTLEQLEEDLKEIKLSFDFKVLIIDLPQLLELCVGTGNYEQDQLVISRGIEDLAKKLDIVIIKATQTKRSQSNKMDFSNPWNLSDGWLLYRDENGVYSLVRNRSEILLKSELEKSKFF